MTNVKKPAISGLPLVLGILLTASSRAPADDANEHAGHDAAMFGSAELSPQLTLHGFSDDPLNVCFIETAGGRNFDALFSIRGHISCSHGKDAIGIDIERYLDLRDSPRGRREPIRC